MRIRTKLVLAFFLLAVLPLATIVFMNYLSSIRVFRRAVETEVRSQALELNDRMDEARSELGRRIRALGSMSLDTLAPDSGFEFETDYPVARPLDELGRLAPMVESVEVIPLPASPGERPAEGPEPDAPAVPPGPRAELEEPSSFVIYLDHVIEAAEALEDDPATREDAKAGLEDATAGLTEEIIDGLGLVLGDHVERLAAEAEQVEEQIATNQRQVEKLSEVLQDPSLTDEERAELNAERRRAAQSLRQAAREKRRLEEREVESLQRGWEEAKRLLGTSFDWRIEQDGQVVGEVRAQISPQHLLASILGHARRDQGEVPFALGPERTLYTVEPADQAAIEGLDLESLEIASDRPYIAFRDGWLIVASTDPESDVTLGIARPIAESLAAMRQNSVRNFGFGLGAIVFAMIGILPLSRRMTRNIRQLSHSVDRLAEGETAVEVDIRSKDEIGQLARNFNRMASDLHRQRERLIDEVERREEQETRQRLLAAENERKSRELEDARAFQLSLLPNRVPEHPDLSLAVYMQTATEVGGDYYDFLPGDDGALTIALGDATGHGAKAGTMVTALKSLFMASAQTLEPADFLERSSKAIKRMNLGRMTMALTLVRYQGNRLAIACAGMPPPLVWRARSGEIEEIDLVGLPLGGLADSSYRQAEAGLGQGDVLLLMSDGFPEMANAAGDPLGYPAARKTFQRLASRAPQDILHGLEEAGAQWRGSRALLDDVTFVVVRKSSV